MYITYIIIAATVMVSLLAFNNAVFFANNVFHPSTIVSRKQWHRFFTHALLHADYLHLFVNMYSLFLFGPMVEEAFYEIFGKGKGSFLFILLYVSSIVLSSYPSFEKHKNNPGYSAVGASGAIAAVVFACAFIFPMMKLGFLFIPFLKLPAFVLGFLYLVYSWYMGRKQSDRIAHDAHFYGAVFGVLFCILIRWQFLPDFWRQVQNYF